MAQHTRPLTPGEANAARVLEARVGRIVLLYPTPNILVKSTFDAVESLRDYLRDSGYHDYYAQPPGGRVHNPASILHDTGTKTTTLSLYRQAKTGADPRIWWWGLASMMSAGDVLATFVHGGVNYVVNLTTSGLRESNSALGQQALAALESILTGATAPTSDGLVVGVDYNPANETVTSAAREPFEVDPDAVDRSTQAHAKTQNQIADHVRALGHVPRSPTTDEPQYDLAWNVAQTTFVVEVKSLTATNEERQLRLGLGQVLRYQQLLAAGIDDVRAVLAVEREPGDRSWIDLCGQLGVLLVWPGHLDALSED